MLERLGLRWLTVHFSSPNEGDRSKRSCGRCQGEGIQYYPQPFRQKGPNGQALVVFDCPIDLLPSPDSTRRCNRFINELLQFWLLPGRPRGAGNDLSHPGIQSACAFSN